MRRLLVISLAAVVAIAGLLFLGQVRENLAERCTESWDAATPINVSSLTLAPEDVGRISPVRRVDIAGRVFEVQASINKSMGWASAPVNPFHRQRTGVIFQVIGKDEATVKALVPHCIRAMLGAEVWERRAHARTDIHIRGIAGDAVGGAGAINGPEWPGGAIVRLQLLASFEGARYVLDATDVPVVRTD
jgi:hypothetical protein